MTRMTKPDCAVMCNLINIHTYIHIYIYTYMHRGAGGGGGGVGAGVLDSENNGRTQWQPSPIGGLS